VLASHLSSIDAPVVYVEKPRLINSLFGLLSGMPFCTAAGRVFSIRSRAARPTCTAPISGCAAPAGSTPVSPSSTAAATSRPSGATSAQDRHPVAIRVFWEAIDEPLLAMALDCLPPLHLRKCFERILQDIKTNRSGLRT